MKTDMLRFDGAVERAPANTRTCSNKRHSEHRLAPPTTVIPSEARNPLFANFATKILLIRFFPEFAFCGIFTTIYHKLKVALGV